MIDTFNFYKQFIKRAANVLAQLNDKLKSHLRKNNRILITWTPVLSIGFDLDKTEFL